MDFFCCYNAKDYYYMKKLFIILLSALSLTAFAQQKKVAVYITGEQTGEKKVLGDKLTYAFAKSGKYIAVERTSSFLEELGREQNYQHSGVVNDTSIARMGIQFGVHYVCVAEISDAFGEKYISARLIDVETAEIVNNYSVNGVMKDMTSCIKMADEIANHLTKGTFSEQAEIQYAETIQQQQDIARNRINKSWDDLLMSRIKSSFSEDRYTLGNVNSNKGIGLELFPNGRYILLHCGEYSFGDWVGEGLVVFTDGTAFVGEFKSAYQWIIGSYYDETSKLIHYGKFAGIKPSKNISRNDGFEYTFGIINYENGDKYVGELKNGIKSGKGLYIWAEGESITWYGEWKDGIRTGNGIYYYDDGSKYLLGIGRGVTK